MDNVRVCSFNQSDRLVQKWSYLGVRCSSKKRIDQLKNRPRDTFTCDWSEEINYEIQELDDSLKY